MKKILVGIAAISLMAGLALAQVPGLFIASPTGNEQINVLVPSTGAVMTSPQITSITVRQVRDASGYMIQAQAAAQTVNIPNGVSVVSMTGATVGTTATFVTPPAPVDGQRMQIYSQAGITTLTITASAGQTIGNTVTGISALDNIEYIYQASTTTWWLIQ